MIINAIAPIAMIPAPTKIKGFVDFAGARLRDRVFLSDFADLPRALLGDSLLEGLEFLESWAWAFFLCLSLRLASSRRCTSLMLVGFLVELTFFATAGKYLPPILMLTLC